MGAAGADRQGEVLPARSGVGRREPEAPAAAVLRALHHRPDHRERRRRVRRVRQDRERAPQATLRRRTEDLHDARPRLAGGRAVGGERAVPGVRGEPELRADARYRHRVRRQHDRRHPHDALGSQLPAGPVEPGRRASSAGLRVQAVHPGRRVPRWDPARLGVLDQVAALPPPMDGERLLVRVERRRGRRRRLREPVGRHQGLHQRGVRAADPGGRPRQGRAGGTRHGDRVGSPRGAVADARDGGRDTDRDGVGVSDARERREALRALHRDEGRRCRRRPVSTQAGLQAGRVTRDRAPGDRDAAGRRVRRNRHRGRAGVVAGRGQDRDDPGLHERLVRRVHPAGLDRGMGGLPRNARLALAVLRRVGVRRNARRTDLARLHAAGHGGDAGRELPRAAGAPVGDGARCGRAAVRARTERARQGELHTARRGRRLRRSEGHGRRTDPGRRCIARTRRTGHDPGQQRRPLQGEGARRRGDVPDGRQGRSRGGRIRRRGREQARERSPQRRCRPGSAARRAEPSSCRAARSPSRWARAIRARHLRVRSPARARARAPDRDDPPAASVSSR